MSKWQKQCFNPCPFNFFKNNGNGSVVWAGDRKVMESSLKRSASLIMCVALFPMRIDKFFPTPGGVI